MLTKSVLHSNESLIIGNIDKSGSMLIKSKTFGISTFEANVVSILISIILIPYLLLVGLHRPELVRGFL